MGKVILHSLCLSEHLTLVLNLSSDKAKINFTHQYESEALPKNASDLTTVRKPYEAVYAQNDITVA
jgi:hypothetical protein